MGVQTFVVQVRYEWDKEYRVRAADEDEAEALAVAQAKDDIQDEVGETPPSASEFETYIL